MKKVEENKKSNVIEVIIEPSEETVDFTDFVREVLEYQMARVGVIACSVNLERPQGKLKSSKESK